jgi:hemerythrin-like domain-containing protein
MRAIGFLEREHAAITEMIARLEAEIATLERGEVDGEGVERLLAFFEHEVDGRHQEKEERIFLPRLVTRAQGEDAVLAQLALQDHAAERTLLALMRTNVEGASYGEPNCIAAVARAARRYVHHLRAHSSWEQEVIFPLARWILTAQDDRKRPGRAEAPSLTA